MREGRCSHKRLERIPCRKACEVQISRVYCDWRASPAALSITMYFPFRNQKPRCWICILGPTSFILCSHHVTATTQEHQFSSSNGLGENSQRDTWTLSKHHRRSPAVSDPQLNFHPMESAELVYRLGSCSFWLENDATHHHSQTLTRVIRH